MMNGLTDMTIILLMEKGADVNIVMCCVGIDVLMCC